MVLFKGISMCQGPVTGGGVVSMGKLKPDLWPKRRENNNEKCRDVGPDRSCRPIDSAFILRVR